MGFLSRDRDGSVDVLSVPGQGRFDFLLPLSSAAGEEAVRGFDEWCSGFFAS